MFPFMQSGRCTTAAPSAVCVCLHGRWGGTESQLEEETVASRSTCSRSRWPTAGGAFFIFCRSFFLLTSRQRKSPGKNPFNTHSFKRGRGQLSPPSLLVLPDSVSQNASGDPSVSEAGRTQRCFDAGWLEIYELLQKENELELRRPVVKGGRLA